MRLCSYNVENLFRRVKAMNVATWEDGRAVLEDYAAFNRILGKRAYTAADKSTLVDILKRLGLAKKDDGKFAVLRQNRGKLVKRTKGGRIEIAANGRDEWVGWLELKTESVNDVAVLNTGRVIRDVNPDILAVIEAEDRIALCRFNDDVIRHVGGTPYGHIMLIDGNDERGIDVGLMTRQGFDIVSIASHVDDVDEKGRVFSRDCPEYRIRLPSGAEILLLVNHLKSKGFGSQASSDARRLRQAKRVRAIYDAHRAAGVELIAIVGDFNDFPGRAPLAPLLGDGSDLRDVADHPNFVDDGFPGTYANGNARDKIDLIMLSPALFQAVSSAGVNRTGVWGNKNGDRWPRLAELEFPHQAASDHAAVFVDLAI